MTQAITAPGFQPQEVIMDIHKDLVTSMFIIELHSMAKNRIPVNNLSNNVKLQYNQTKV